MGTHSSKFRNDLDTPAQVPRIWSKTWGSRPDLSQLDLSLNLSLQPAKWGWGESPNPARKADKQEAKAC